MPSGSWKRPIQNLLAKSGYQLRRAEPGSSIDDPYAMQLSVLGPGIETIFEVGAADGRDTGRYRTDFPGATIYAFEPVPESFAQVEARAASDPQLIPIRKALSDSAGTATFHVARSQDSSSLLPPRETGSRFDELQRTESKLEVETATLDGFCEENGIERVDLLKIDAQGAESMILSGAERMLGTGSIDVIFLEVHFLPSYEGAKRYDELATILYGHGFDLFNLYDLHHNQRGELCWGDALFVRSGFSRGDGTGPG